MGQERLNDRGRERLLAGLAAGGPEGEVGVCVLAKECLRDVYAASDLDGARRRLAVFRKCCADAKVPELTRLAKTISAWEQEVLALPHDRHVERAHRGREPSH